MLFTSVTGVVIAVIAGSSKLATFLEEDYVYDEEGIDIPPLSQAAQDNDSEKLQQLITDGADLEEKDSEGSTALQHAIIWGNVEAAKSCLKMEPM